jgi:hypothetical protein
MEVVNTQKALVQKERRTNQLVNRIKLGAQRSVMES